MAATLVDHLWQSTLFALVVALLVLALRRNGAHIRYGLWLAASIKFTIPFSLLIALGAQLEWNTAVAPRRPGFDLAPHWTDFAATVIQPAGESLTLAPTVAAIDAERTLPTAQSIVIALWLCGFLAVIGVWAVRWLRLQNILRRAVPLIPAAGSSIDFPVPIMSAPGSLEPGIVGIRRPFLLLPQGLYERLSPQQLQAILAHEFCHLRRRDNLTATVHMLVEAVFWFHPLVWWIGARLVEERERACDAAVLGAGNDPETYAAGILDVCQHYVATPLDCVAGVSGADLKKRVRAIMMHQGEARLHFCKIALIAAVSCGIVTIPVVVGALTSTQADARGARNIGSGDVDEWPAIGSLSISLSQAEPLNGRGLLISPSGTFTTRNIPLRSVIGFAYGLQDSEILELNADTNDLASGRYNIAAKIEAAAPTASISKQQLQAMVRRILAEQFALSFHWETHRVPVYELTSMRTTGNIQLAADGDPGPLLNLGANSVTGNAIPITLLNQFLAPHLKRPIVDRTGLEGNYNLKLSWSPGSFDDGNSSDPAAARALRSDVLISALTEQLGFAVTSKDGKVRRMVIDGLKQATDLKPVPVEIQLDPAIFDRYVGHYDFPPGRIMTIFRSGERFYAEMTGQSSIQILASSDRHFFAKAVGAELSFTIVGNQVNELVLTQNGNEIHAPRLDAAVANSRAAQLSERIRTKTALPGSETALRNHFAGLQVDAPKYEMMTKELEAAVRAEWPSAKQRFARIGALQSVEFKGVGPTGADIYVAKFENSSSEWRVGLNSDGKVNLLAYRRLTNLN